MKLSARHLEVIRTVIRMGSVTDAAEALDISQPAVSMVLKECDRRTGFSLFVRKQGRLQPTREARLLVPELDRIFDGIERMQRLVADLREGEIGLVRIATTPTLADNLLPFAIQAFHKARPGVQVSVHTMLNYEVADDVATERVDFGLALSSDEHADTRVTDLCASDLVCIAPAQHAIARRAAVDPLQLRNFPLISFSRSLPLGSLIEAAFRSRGLVRHIAIEVSQSSTACALVRAGLGVAVIDPFALLEDGGRGLATLPFTPRTALGAQILLPKIGRPSRPAQRLIQNLHEIAKTLIARRVSTITKPEQA